MLLRAARRQHLHRRAQCAGRVFELLRRSCTVASDAGTSLHSPIASRASSTSERAPTPSPKNCAARSGNWCASSTTNACAPGRISPKPSCFSARSASNRWWLTTTISATCARWRACTTKHSDQNGHSLPRQFSAVEVTSGSSGESSGSASSSARSPMRVRPPHATTRWNCAICSRELNMPLASGFAFRLFEPVLAQVIGAALQQRRRHADAERIAHARQVAEVQLVLQRAGAGGNDRLLPRQQRRDQVGIGLAGAGAGLGEQYATLPEGLRDGLGQALLRRARHERGDGFGECAACGQCGAAAGAEFGHVESESLELAA